MIRKQFAYKIPSIVHFPFTRLRRLRYNPRLREMVAESTVHPSDLVYPMFVVPGEGVREEIASMPGIYHLSIDRAIEEARQVRDLGIPAVLLFGIPERKDPVGSEAYAEDGIVQRAVSALREKVEGLLIITDVCMCEYTSHGHCGVVADGDVDNDRTLELLARAAVSHARAGAHVVAPSDMMDGRVAAIREALDEQGLTRVPIMSYAAKYASSFYGPFREAAHSTPAFGDRRSYQMPPPNLREAMREIELDVAEGADIIIVKPALAYTDVIREARERFDHPIAAYNVSGEYAMVKAAAANGWIDEARVVEELLVCIKRAGADIIITYHAKDFARAAAARKE